MNQKFTCRVMLVLVALAPLEAHAQFKKLFGGIKDAASDLGKAAWNVTKAPTQVVINSAQVIRGNGDIRQIYKPYQDAASQAGRAVSSTTRAVLNPQQDLYNEAQKFAGSIGGPSAFIFDVATFTNRYFTDLGLSGGAYLGNVLQGQSPFQVYALPLAAAIRSARQRYAAGARPVPEDVKAALRGRIPDATLDRAKYAIGKLEITLPAMFNFLNVNLSNAGNHAVTVDDIIVFHHDPGSYNASICHWTHELLHVDQYRRWGIEDFAWKFLNSYPVEKEANQQGSAITGYNCQNGAEGIMGFAGGSSNGQQSRPVLYNSQTSETYVAQCIFYDNPYPNYYFVTNTNRIIAVDYLNNAQLHIGYAAAPLNPVAAWDIAAPNFRYAVTADSKIWCSFPVVNQFGQQMLDGFGRPMFRDQVIGYVQRL